MGGDILAPVLVEIPQHEHASPFSGDYNDLTNKPDLFSGRYADLSDKPELFSGNYVDLTGKPEIPDRPDVSAFLNQTQVDDRVKALVADWAESAHSRYMATVSFVSDIPVTGRGLAVPAQSVTPFVYIGAYTIPADSVQADSTLLFLMSVYTTPARNNENYNILCGLQRSTDGGATWSSVTSGFDSLFSTLDATDQVDNHTRVAIDQPGTTGEIRYRMRIFHWINQEASLISDGRINIIEL